LGQDANYIACLYIYDKIEPKHRIILPKELIDESSPEKTIITREIPANRHHSANANIKTRE